MCDSVTVALRVRPLINSELERGCRISVQRPVPDVPQVIVNQGEVFTYNYVFDSSDTQQTIYESCVRSKLKKLIEGYNITILAYGQTGSGKTYTMGTAFNGIMDDDVGVIPRAVYEIFQETAALDQDYSFKITCSFVELYQEQFYDLFSPNKREDSTVGIREDKNRIVIPGLTEVEVTEAKQVTDQLMRGSSGRAVAATAMNETSSRSHAIFTLTVVATKKNGEKSVTTSKFNLVDLAGSERCSKTLASGDRFKEGVNINKGLLALGNVINVLGSGQTAGYVPYRQSKLTHLLKDSLGGNSITLMIACVSPADYNMSETLSTLRYADRALEIKNKPVVNLDPHAAEVMMLKEIIQKLRIELLASSSGSGNINDIDVGCINGGNSAVEGQRFSEQLRRLQEENVRIEKKDRKLQQELHQALIQLAEKEMRAHIAEVTHEKLMAQVVELKAKLREVGLAAAKESDGEEKQEHTQHHWQEQLREISQLVTTVEEELLLTESELQMHRKECLDGGNSEESCSGSDEAHALLQSRTEEHTTKQLNLNGELRNINRQLDLKQELHERVTRNFSKLQGDDIDEKYKQCEQKIEQLEMERRELLDLVRTSKQKDTTAKLAEERRKRLQILEQEIVEMRRKIVQQANMLKMREKEREKIQNLSSEIRAMKESKVKLIRAMRGESERFRQWKMMSEKQLTQLKSKDRKMQSEMVRQQTLHAKQRQVLKRKCEEAQATNKRLKDALERQRAAQAQRQKHAKDQPGTGKLDALVDRELEVILSLIDAEHSLEQLMEDRAIINAHCNQIKQQSHPDDEEANLLASLEDELEMRNAQIADLQQKVCTNDIDSRMHALCDSVQSLGDSRAISKQLLKGLVHQRREQAQGIMEQKVLLDEQRTQLLDVQQRNDELAKRLRQAECKHEELMVSQQRSYEDKVAVLLRSSPALKKDGGPEQPEDLERQKIIEELLSTKEALQQELDKLKAKSKLKNRKLSYNESLIMLSDIESNEDEDFLTDIDPDWVPKKKRSKKSNSSTTEPLTPEDNCSSNNNNSSNNTLQSSIDMSSAQMSDETRNRGLKRCNCRTKCNTRRCGCYARGEGCTSGCKCLGCCANSNNSNNTDKENSTPQMLHNVTVTLSSHSPKDNSPIKEADESPNSEALDKLSIPLMPNSFGPLSIANSLLEKHNSKLPRHSQLSFNTPSSNKKFF